MLNVVVDICSHFLTNLLIIDIVLKDVSKIIFPNIVEFVDRLNKNQCVPGDVITEGKSNLDFFLIWKPQKLIPAPN